MIEKIVIISFIVFSVWYTMQEGEIFSKLGRWFEKKLPEKIHDPVFACFICMTPWYGTAIYFILPLLPEWIPMVIAAMGLNAVLSKLFRDD